MTKRKLTLKKADKAFAAPDIQTVEEDQKPYIIKDAAIKDGFCNYTFEITDGMGIGDTHNVKGSGIIDDDMRHSFGRFHVHLAAIDDVFKHSGIEIDDIDNFHGHDLAHIYSVTGLKIKGSKENESIILVGTKYVSSAGGRIAIESPKIPLDNLSSYKWYNELKVAADNARREVELYKEGKYTAVEEDDEDATPNAKQLSIGDQINGDDSKVFVPGGFKTMLTKGNDVKWDDEDNDDELENAKL